MFVFISLCCVILVTAALLWQRRLSTSKYDLPPQYPGHLPIIGHSHLIMGNLKSLWLTVKTIAKETTRQGGVLSMSFGRELYYLIADPEDAMTAANSCLKKNFLYDFAKPWLGDGLITGSGGIWKRHRKLLTPAFSLPVVQSFLGVFNRQSREFLQEFEDKVGKGPFDHTTYLRTDALKTFCLTSFGIDILKDQDFLRNYVDATEKILKIIAKRFQYPWLQSDLIFKLSGLQRTQDNLIKILNDMSDMIIKKKRAAFQKGDLSEVATVMKESGEKYKAFLDLVMELSHDNALTDKEIREEVDTAIVAGFETSSNVLSFVLMMLGTHPEVQDKLYYEINTLFETDRDVEKQDLPQLEYMEAVIKETMRIYTIVPISFRFVDKSVKLKNYTMRPGSQCIVFLYATNQSTVWGEDAEVFRPERWLEPGGVPENPNAFAGFSLGKRSCVGRTYAMTAMKTQLVHFLRRYRVRADASNLLLQMDFLLKPVSGHEITIENRC